MRLGDSLDMKVANLAIAYETYVNQKHKSGTKDKTDHGYSTQDLLSMVKNTKERNNGGKNSK
jgi:hypothetical protein